MVKLRFVSYSEIHFLPSGTEIELEMNPTKTGHLPFLWKKIFAKTFPQTNTRIQKQKLEVRDTAREKLRQFGDTLGENAACLKSFSSTFLVVFLEIRFDLKLKIAVLCQWLEHSFGLLFLAILFLFMR